MKCDDPIVTCSPNGTRQRSTLFTSLVSCSDTSNLRYDKINVRVVTDN
jgi:hypothetical protein